MSCYIFCFCTLLKLQLQNCVCLAEEAASLCLCLWRITQVLGYSAVVTTRTRLNSPIINTYYRCTVVIQDKPKTRFGKWIHGVLAYYIHLVHFEHKIFNIFLFSMYIFLTLTISNTDLEHFLFLHLQFPLDNNDTFMLFIL